MTRLLPALAALAAVSCARNAPSEGPPAGSGALVSLYKAEIGGGGLARGHAKVSVWAADPDRLHAEILSPVGGVAYLLDAGAGRVCVTDVSAAAAYVGDDGPGAFGALIGVRVSVPDAVAALLHGASPPGLSVTRANDPEGGLPSALRIADEERFLALDRLRVSRTGGEAALLGTGEPPDNLPLHPIEELAERLEVKQR